MVTERTKQRTRSLTGSGYAMTAWGHGNSPNFTRGVFADVFQKDITETIGYTVGRNRFNDCDHSVHMSTQFQPASSAEMTSPYVMFKGASSPGELPQLWAAPSEPCSIHPRSRTVAMRLDAARVINARLDAYNKLVHMNPPKHMNVTQAVCELKDLKQTLNPLLAFIGWVRRTQGSAVPVASRAGRLIKRRLSTGMRLAEVASAYLWYQFGVEPTRQDVERFVDEIDSGKLRVRGDKPRVVEAGTVVVSRYSVRPRRPDILALMYPNAPSGSFNIEKELGIAGRGAAGQAAFPPTGVRDPFYCRSVFTYDETTGAYFARVKETFEIDGLEQFRNRFQWNCPALRTVWELIPFSFLVDWVVDVGSFIERLEKRYLSQNYSAHLGAVWRWEKVTSAVYSPALSSFHVEGEPVSPPTSTDKGGRFKMTGGGSLSYYRSGSSSVFHRREVGAPALALPELATSIKAYQISSGMALLIQAAKAWRS